MTSHHPDKVIPPTRTVGSQPPGPTRPTPDSRKAGSEWPEPALASGAAFGVRNRDLRSTRTFVSVSGMPTASIGARHQSHPAQRVPRLDGVSFHDPFHGGTRSGAAGPAGKRSLPTSLIHHLQSVRASGRDRPAA